MKNTTALPCGRHLEPINIWRGTFGGLRLAKRKAMQLTKDEIDAHARKLLEDVEPVAFMFQHSETGRITFVDTWQKNNGWATANPRYKEVGALHGASTVAALKAQVEELEQTIQNLEIDLLIERNNDTRT